MNAITYINTSVYDYLRNFLIVYVRYNGPVKESTIYGESKSKFMTEKDWCHN